MVQGKAIPYPIENYLSDAIFSVQQKAFLAAVSAGVEPKFYHDAIKDKAWRNAMCHEIAALEKQRTWDLVDLPEGKVSIGCKWVYKLKYNADGTLERHKARLIVLRNHQVEVFVQAYNSSHSIRS